MKRSQIILFTVFIILFGSIYIMLSSNKKEYKKNMKEGISTVYVPVREVNNVMRNLVLTSYGQVTPNTEVIVSFEVQGKLKKGASTLKPGSSFKKGQILYRINNEEAFYTLSARKSALSNVVLAALPDIELDYPSEREKWIDFLNGLHPGKLLPELPVMNSSKERMFITSRNIISEYYNLKSMESRMEKYLFVAPFSGTVVATFLEPGSIANPGGQIAKIVNTGNFEVKVPISMEDLNLYKNNSTADFTDAGGKLVARGKIIRISDVINQQTQAADVYYEINPVNGEKVYNGMFVNVSIQKESEKETMTLPRVAVKNNTVKILVDSTIVSQPIIIVGSKPDSVFVTGLENGQMAILEPILKEEKEVKFEGIIR